MYPLLMVRQMLPLFPDWIVAMDDYFDWYEMFGIKRVRFAKMKLIGPARKF